MLVDIVSKNGNLLLDIPVRGDGTIDGKEVAILEGIADWMEVNKESIFDTRPWKMYGEGPSVDSVNALNGAGFNEGKIGYTEKDIRYNQKGNVLYATVMSIPTDDISFELLAKNIEKRKIKKIELLGSKEKLIWKQSNDKLLISKPKVCPNNIALVFKIIFAK
jgi:alpha-L-fucosidase